MPSDMIIVGDFNMRPTEAGYTALIGTPDDYFGRKPHLDGFADSWTLAGHDENDGPTWWDRPDERPRRLDYVLVSAGLAPHVHTCRVLGGDLSDHQPVVVELDIA